MNSSWYYSRDTTIFGPYSAAEIKDHAARKMLLETDLIWQGKDGRAGAVEARGALDFASLPKVASSKPDWLDDIAAEEKTGPMPGPLAAQEAPEWLDDLRLWYGLELCVAEKASPPTEPNLSPTGGVPDWLEGWLAPDKPRVVGDVRAQPAPSSPLPFAQPAQKADATKLRPSPVPELPAVPLAQPVARAKTKTDALAAKAIEETGFDPQTGRILDAHKFRAWQKAAHSKKTGVTNESLFESFRKARTAIEQWVDEDSRRLLIMSGDLAAIKKDAELTAILRRYEGYGSPMRDKLIQHLEFMVENRRKYYAACP